MSKKTAIRCFVTFTISWFLLSACQSKVDTNFQATPALSVTHSSEISPSLTQTPTFSPTLTPSPEPSPTIAPRDTSTPSLTPLPTETPEPSLTPVPWSVSKISPANANRVTQLAVWGHGKPLRMEITPGAKFLLVQTPLGLYVYDFSTLDVITFFENAQEFLVSPDGQFMAVSYPGVSTVELWGIEAGRTLYQLVYLPPSEITAMAFNIKRSVLAVGYSDSHINLWDLKDGSISQELEHPIIHAITSFAFSPDGTKLATNSQGRGVIAVWSLVESKLLWRTANGGLLSTKSFTPDSKTLITVGLLNSKIMFWDVEEGQLLKSFGAANLQDLIGYSKDKLNMIVYGVKEQSGTEFLELRSMQDGELQETLAIPAGNTIIDSQYQSLLVLDENGLRRFALATWEWISISDEPDMAGELLTSSSGDEVSVFGKSFASTWQVSTGKTLSSNSYDKSLYDTHLPGVIDGAKWMPGNKVVAWGRNGAELFWWDVTSGAVDRLSLEGWPLNRSTFSSKTATIAVCTETSLDFVKTVDSSRQTFERCRQSGFLAFSPDGATLARTSVLVLDLLQSPDWTLAHTMYGHTLPIEIVAYSPSGGYIASGTTVDRGGSELAIWRTDPPSQWMQFVVPSYGIDSLAFSWNDKLLATGGGGTQVRLWRVTDGWMLDSLDLESTALSLAFSPDSQILAVGTNSGELDLFDVSTSEVLQRFEAHKDAIIDLEFSSDGRNLITASYDGTVRLWGLP